MTQSNTYSRFHGDVIGAMDMCAVSAEVLAVVNAVGVIAYYQGWDIDQLVVRAVYDAAFVGVACDDRILFASSTTKLFVFDTLNIQTPRVIVDIPCVSRPKILSDGSVVVLIENDILQCYDVLGDRLWTVQLEGRIEDIAVDGTTIFAVTADGRVWLVVGGQILDYFQVKNLRGAQEILVASGYLFGVGQEHVVIHDLATDEQVMVDHDAFNQIARVFRVASTNQKFFESVSTPPFVYTIDNGPPFGALAGAPNTSTAAQPPSTVPADADLRARRLSTPFTRFARSPELEDAFKTLAVQYGRRNFPSAKLADSTMTGALLRCINNRWVRANTTTGELSWTGSELMRFSFTETDAAVQATERHSRLTYSWINGPVEVTQTVPPQVYHGGQAVKLTNGQQLIVPTPQLFLFDNMISFSVRLRRGAAVAGDRTVIQCGNFAMTVDVVAAVIKLWINGVFVTSAFDATLASPSWNFIGVTVIRHPDNTSRMFIFRGGLVGFSGGPLAAFQLGAKLGIGGPSEIIDPPPAPHLVAFDGELADVRIYTVPQDSAAFSALSTQAIPP
jgi:hypothetical protein